MLEIIFRDHLFLDHFVGFGQHFKHVGNVEMADVGTEHHVEPGLERIAFAVKCGRGDRVVRFAAEVKVRHEQVADVLLALDLAAREIVDIGGVFGRDNGMRGFACRAANRGSSCRHSDGTGRRTVRGRYGEDHSCTPRRGCAYPNGP